MFLSPADGAKFQGVIEELPNGQWRASTRVTLDTLTGMLVETVNIEMFDTEEAATNWAKETGRERGFTVYLIDVKRLS